MRPPDHLEDPSLSFNITTATKWVIAAAMGFYISLPTTVRILLVLMAADFLTGVLVASKEKQIDLRTARKGFNVKVLILLLTAIAHFVSEPLSMGVDLGVWVAGAYSITELFSIVENCARAGVPIPNILIEAMVKIKPVNKTGEDAVKALEGDVVVKEQSRTEKTSGDLVIVKEKESIEKTKIIPKT